MPEKRPPDVEDLKAANAREIHRAVSEEGVAEMARPLRSLFWSGLAAGLAISASLLAEGSLRARLPDTPSRELIMALGYPIGLDSVIDRMILMSPAAMRPRCQPSRSIIVPSKP